jgi:hypothetical protein
MNDMAHDHHNPEPVEVDPNATHEIRDVRIRPIIWFLVGLAIFTIIMCGLMALLFKQFENSELKAEGAPPPMAAGRDKIPPEPRLQLAPTAQGQQTPDLRDNSPILEMKHLRETQEAQLNNYTWLDAQKSMASIPIDEAKRLALQRGLLQARPPVKVEAPTEGEAAKSETAKPAESKSEVKPAATKGEAKPAAASGKPH